MRRSGTMGSVLAAGLVLGGLARAETGDGVNASNTLALVRQVADWQLGQLRTNGGWRASTDWVRGALLTGVMAAYRTTGSAAYYDAAVGLCATNAWQLGRRPRHADDHCVGQTYAELYQLSAVPARLAALRKGFDFLVANPKPGREDWWWCDALYMAPPAMVRLSAVTGERAYIDLMHKMWWDTSEFLYDPEEHLFYRDKRFFPMREPNGSRVFWSRGNGWVMGGLARVLQYLPPQDPARPRYVAQFRAMAKKLAGIQPADGLWRASLLDPGSCPLGEASGSGFFCFSLAWGVNEGLLDRATFEPVVLKAWSALGRCVQPSGKLGYVQRIGDRPAALTPDDTQEYGVGAFLLAGEQLLKLLGRTPPVVAAPATAGGPPPGPRAFGRFVPERLDDVAWENDRIAFRVYGPALAASKEPAGSGVDVWVKSVRHPVVDKWYKSGAYHKDHGEGLDGYKVGFARGCGGLGVWDGGKLWTSGVWQSQRVLENPPERIVLELAYAPWQAGTRKVSETRRITLPMGTNLNRVESRFESDDSAELVVGIGISLRKGTVEALEDKALGVLSYWEPALPGQGQMGCAVLVNPAQVVDLVRTADDLLILVKAPVRQPLVYYTGAGWSKGLDFPDRAAWERYVRACAAQIEWH